MTINIEYEAEEKLDLDYEKIITDVVNEAVDYEKCPYEAEINLLLTENAHSWHITAMLAAFYVFPE